MNTPCKNKPSEKMTIFYLCCSSVTKFLLTNLGTLRCFLWFGTICFHLLVASSAGTHIVDVRHLTIHTVLYNNPFFCVCSDTRLSICIVDKAVWQYFRKLCWSCQDLIYLQDHTALSHLRYPKRARVFVMCTNWRAHKSAPLFFKFVALEIGWTCPYMIFILSMCKRLFAVHNLWRTVCKG